MESVLILCNKSPFGTNSVNEAIRLGSGFIALGELLDCKIFLYGEAVLAMKKGLKPELIGLDSFDEGLEMADLSELPIVVAKEDCEKFNISQADLFEFEEIPIEIISKNDLSKLIAEFDTVFQI